MAVPSSADVSSEQARNSFRERFYRTLRLRHSPGVIGPTVSKNQSKTKPHDRGPSLQHNISHKSKEHTMGIIGMAAHEGRELADSIAKLGPKPLATMFQVAETADFDDTVDDRKYVMEKLIQGVIKDENGLIGQHATQSFINTLWNDLPHPPAETLAADSRFRSPDGSGNSLLFPQLGAAGQAYSRTVKPSHVQSAVQPDPEVLFDCLMARRAPKDHPAQISSMLFYIATIIIHDLFRTDHNDFNLSKTSSYLDLAPLYGSNEAESQRMRSGNKDGKLKPDCFSETRLLMLPPGSGILLIMFNRHHNYVADQLVAINEDGRFTVPQKPQEPQKDTEDYEKKMATFQSDSSAYQKKLDTLDYELFNTARLITTGLYVNIILIDYVRTILNMNRTDATWQLNPRLEYPGGAAMGVGNQVSAEFNLVYRWHATVSRKDEQWTEETFKELFHGKTPQQVGLMDFLKVVGPIEAEEEAKVPFDREFQTFKRQPDGSGSGSGYYPDDDLINHLVSRINDCANAYGPRQVPHVLRVIEILGIEQARTWKLSTLNEFRKHFSLDPHESFEDITTDAETAAHLKRLYGHPDNVELYPGLVVEDAKKPMVPGSGLCPSFTVSRAVLSDAVTLVRGDRFYTTAYHPKILTNWGYSEAGFDTDVDCGCVMYKLFQRAFPTHFDPDSIYTHFPLTVAKEVKNEILPNNLRQKAHLYETTLVKDDEAVKSYNLITAPSTMESDTSLDLSLATRLLLYNGKDMGKDNSKATDATMRLLSKVLTTKIFHSSAAELEESYQDVQAALKRDVQHRIDRESHPLAKFSEVDVVKNVIGPALLDLTISIFHIPKPDNGNLTRDELETVLTTIAATWSAFDVATLTALRQKASALVKRLRQAMLGTFSISIWSDYEVSKLRKSIFKHLHASGIEKEDQLFSAVLILASSFYTTVLQHSAEILDHLLQADPIVLPSPGSISDAIETALSSCNAAVAVHNDPNSGQDTAAGVSDKLLFTAATITSNSHAAFPYNIATGLDDPAWQELHRFTLIAILTNIFALPDLKPAKVWTRITAHGIGDSRAKLKKIPVHTGHARGLDAARTTYLDEDWARFVPFPTTLKVNFALPHHH